MSNNRTRVIGVRWVRDIDHGRYEVGIIRTPYFVEFERSNGANYRLRRYTTRNAKRIGAITNAAYNAYGAAGVSLRSDRMYAAKVLADYATNKDQS